MSFASPPVLLALLAIPLLIQAYVSHQRRRRRAAEAFVTRRLVPSVAPSLPGWRRHIPMIAFAVAAAVLVVAAAQPQRSVAVPVSDGAVMLANDVSSSMAATDVRPSRLVAAQRAAQRFIASAPSSIRVGLLEFNQKPYLLQTPTTDHALSGNALTQLHAVGHTAIGDAIEASVKVLTGLRSSGGKRPPGAIVLLSDGTSTGGVNSVVAARYAAGQHIPIYTVALGTQRGAITVHHGKRTLSVPVPVSAQELAQVAQASGGREFTVARAGGLSAVYQHLAVVLGHRHVKRQISAGFAGGGLVLLLLGSVLSLRWFGRLI